MTVSWIVECHNNVHILHCSIFHFVFFITRAINVLVCVFFVIALCVKLTHKKNDEPTWRTSTLWNNVLRDLNVFFRIFCLCSLSLASFRYLIKYTHRNIAWTENKELVPDQITSFYHWYVSNSTSTNYTQFCAIWLI